MKLKNTISSLLSRLSKKQMRYAFALALTFIVFAWDAANSRLVEQPLKDAEAKSVAIQKSIADDEQMIIQVPLAQKKMDEDGQRLNALLAENRQLESEIKSYMGKVSATEVFAALEGLKATSNVFRDALIETENRGDAGIKVKVALDGKYAEISDFIKAMESHEVLKHINSVNYVVKEYPLSHVIIIIDL